MMEGRRRESDGRKTEGGEGEGGREGSGTEGREGREGVKSTCTFNPPSQFSRLGIQASLAIICLFVWAMGGWVALPFFSFLFFFKLVCYAHVFPCTCTCTCTYVHVYTHLDKPQLYMYLLYELTCVQALWFPRDHR